MNLPGKPRYLLDINVVLDHLQQRDPWHPVAKALFRAERQERVDLFVSANTIATIHFLVRRKGTRRKALATISILLTRLRLADVTESVVLRALDLGLDDLEDAIQAASAMAAGIPVLVTRNAKDFGLLPELQVVSPEVALAALPG